MNRNRSEFTAHVQMIARAESRPVYLYKRPRPLTLGQRIKRAIKSVLTF